MRLSLPNVPRSVTTQSVVPTPVRAVLFGCLTACLISSPIYGQRRNLQTSNLSAARLPEPPRELRRALSKAEEYISKGRYSDAVAILNSILGADEQSADENGITTGYQEDYFLKPEAGKPATDSFKRKAMRLLGTMPADGREIVELQLGRDAKRRLAAALDRNSIQELQEVSRKYFHTEAGYEATYLLARYHLDQMRPVAAALQFNRLRETPNANAYEPESSLLYAVCLALAKQDDSAVTALRELRDRYRGAEFQLRGRAVSPPEVDEELLPWLEEFIGQLDVSSSSGLNDWRMPRGTPDRNGQPRGGMPLAKMEFRVHSTVFADDGERVAAYAEEMRRDSRNVLPVMEPLVVGSQLLMRTPRLTYGVNLATGVRVWPYPWDRAEQLQSMTDGNPQAANLLNHRMFEDSTYGKMSSDGRTLFALIDPAFDTGEAQLESIAIRRNLWLRNNNQVQQRSNQLAAIDLESEGKYRWVVGGKDGDHPELQSVYFLGAPLPLDGRLYLIAEWRDEIKLIVLDADDGALLWTQQLAEIDQSGFHFRLPHISGCMPAYSDGVIVCPTASGAIVAVDVGTRTLIWGHPYALDNLPTNSQQRYGQQQQSKAGRKWTDNIPIIANGSVIHTPAGSDRIYCINLLTGERLWRNRRASELYVAGVVDDKVIMVTHTGARAKALATGKTTWHFTMEDAARVSGRGFITDGDLYLPNTNREVQRIDLADGKVKESVQTEYELGNLICHGDFVVSQNYDAVRVFRLRDSTRRSVEARLAKNPNDEVALADHISILIGDGDRRSALEAMRRLVQILETTSLSDDDGPTAGELREDRLEALRHEQTQLMLDLLREDFDANEELVAEVEQLASSPEERQRFGELIADHFYKTGKLASAFQEYVELLESEGLRQSGISNRQTLIPMDDPDYRVRQQEWTANRLRSILDDVDPQQRQSLLDDVRRRVADHIEAGATETVKVWAEVLPEVPGIDVLHLRTAQNASARGDYLEAYLALRSINSDSPEYLEAQAQRAIMLSRRGPELSALHQYQRLAELAGNKRLSNGLTGKELLEQYIARQGVSAGQGYANWKKGKVERLDQPELEAATPADGLRFIPVRGDGEWPESYRVAFDQLRNMILIQDGYGAVVMQVPFNIRKLGFGFTQHPNSQVAKAYGNLLVLALGNEIIAIDALSEVDSSRDRILWTSTKPSAVDSILQFPRKMSFTPGKPHRIPFTKEVISNVTIGGDRLGQLGPVGVHGVCYVHGGDLHCVNALTGEPRWVRKNVGKLVEVYGDDDYVFVIAEGEKQATAYETATGRLLGRRRAPDAKRRWRKSGRCVLTWDSFLTQPYRIRLFDSWEERDIWAEEFPYKSKGCMIGNNELAMLSPDGELSILRVTDGETLLKQQLDGSISDLESIEVRRSAEDYVVLLMQQNDVELQKLLRKERIQIYNPNIGGRQPEMITGQAYCFDRNTGEPRWPQPLRINEFGLTPNQPADVPILVFTRNVSRRTRPIKRYSALVCVDRRNGDLLFADYQIARLHDTLSIRGSVPSQSVNVQVGKDPTKPNAIIALKFTDDKRTQGTIESLAPVQTESRIDEKKEKKPKRSLLDDLFG